MKECVRRFALGWAGDAHPASSGTMQAEARCIASAGASALLALSRGLSDHDTPLAPAHQAGDDVAMRDRPIPCTRAPGTRLRSMACFARARHSPILIGLRETSEPKDLHKAVPDGRYRKCLLLEFLVNAGIENLLKWSRVLNTTDGTRSSMKPWFPMSRVYCLKNRWKMTGRVYHTSTYIIAPHEQLINRVGRARLF